MAPEVPRRLDLAIGSKRWKDSVSHERESTPSRSRRDRGVHGFVHACQAQVPYRRGG
jgi:hypothetical protein